MWTAPYRSRKGRSGESLDYAVFRENLGILVDRTGKTLQELAEELNISTATLSRYLAGDRTPELSYVIKISKYFNISLDWLLGLRGDDLELLPQEIQEIAILYSVAANDDKRVVRTILGKYKQEDSNYDLSGAKADKWFRKAAKRTK